MRKHIFLLALFILCTFAGISNNLDSLLQQLRKDAQNPELLNKIARNYFAVSLDTAFAYSQQAIKYAQKQNNFEQEALALHNTGIYYFYIGSMDSALSYYEQSILINKKIDNQQQIANSLNNIGLIYANLGNNQKAIEYYLKSFQAKKNINDKKGMATALVNLGNIYSNFGSYAQAQQYYQESIELYKEMNDSLGLASAYGNMGIVFKQRGNYDKAIHYYLNALDIREKFGDISGAAATLQNIGGIYHDWQNYDEAIERYEKALKLFEQISDKVGAAFQYNNIALIYIQSDSKHENFAKAQKYLENALQLFQEMNNLKGIAQVYGDMGKLYSKMQKINISTNYLNKALNMYNELKDTVGIITCLNLLGNNHEYSDQLHSASEQYEKALSLSSTISNSSLEIQSLTNLKEVYSKTGNAEKALYYSDIINQLKDSIFTKELHNQIAELEMVYETEKKEKEIEILNKDKILKENEINRQKLMRNFALFGVFFFLILIGALYNRYLYKQKINVLLQQKNDELSKQNEQIEKQKKNITDSIRYAQNIQEAVYPSNELIQRILPQHFIFYKPKDIVSGDFYWIAERQNKKYIVVADCTGHGVPGAFMSLLGITYLNEIMSKYYEISADEILNELREMIMKALKQQSEESKLKDGMDMALCIYNNTTRMMEFAGANNSLFLIRNNELKEFKADLMPIGLYFKMDQLFTKHELLAEPNDKFYLFSDGFIDQFGGNENKKFGTRSFKEFILEIGNESFPKQKDLLNQKHTVWKAGNEQLDDILIMGFSFD